MALKRKVVHLTNKGTGKHSNLAKITKQWKTHQYE